MTQNIAHQPTTREEVLTAFEALLRKHEEEQSKAQTRAQSAAQVEDLEIVERASGYSVEGIVKGLADLQLDFSTSLDSLAELLVGETERLAQLKRSIKVESGRLAHLSDIKVAAEAFQLLGIEQRERREAFDTATSERLEALETEESETRSNWSKEDEAHERASVEFDDNRLKTRAQQEADFTYQQTRDRTIAGDDYEERKAAKERELTELAEELEREWIKRETALDQKLPEIEELRAKVENFPNRLKEETKKARDKAISKTAEEARVEAELMASQYEADEQVFALQIEGLEATIEAQRQQLADLEAQLHAASSQAQDLAMRAIDGTSRRSNAA